MSAAEDAMSILDMCRVRALREAGLYISPHYSAAFAARRGAVYICRYRYGRLLIAITYNAKEDKIEYASIETEEDCVREVYTEDEGWTCRAFGGVVTWGGP